MQSITIGFQWLASGEAHIPQYQSDSASGMDIEANITEPFLLQAGGRVLIPTGFALAIPKGFEVQIRPRSGLALKHGITVLNSPGTIDADYRGEIKILLINLGERSYTIKPRERIAQMVVAPVIKTSLQNIVLTQTKRGSGGFGSTSS